MTKQEILDYLDNVLHTIVSPDNWNVYSELYDMIEELPSAESVRHGKWKAKSFHEFFCDNCGFSFDMMKCDFLENMNYCPYCGARMNEDE